MKETDSKNLAPMVFVSTLRNAATERGATRQSCGLCARATRGLGRPSLDARSGEHPTTSHALMERDDESNGYEVYRLRRDSRVARVSGLQVQKVNTCHPSFLSFLR